MLKAIIKRLVLNVDLIVIGLWKPKRPMNNIIQPFDFHKSTLDQISEEIQILQEEQLLCKDSVDIDSHRKIL